MHYKLNEHTKLLFELKEDIEFSSFDKFAGYKELFMRYQQNKILST